ncbi:hypothetical protein V8B97DRAFT_1919324 [Scleroderma yunnanense]
MPNHVIAIDCWMPSPAMVEQTKTWPDWNKIVDTPGQGEQLATINKSKGRAVNSPPALSESGEDPIMASDSYGLLNTAKEHRGWTTSQLVYKEHHDQSYSQRCCKSITSTPIINNGDNMSAAMESAPTASAATGIHGCTVVFINTPANGFNIIEDAAFLKQLELHQDLIHTLPNTPPPHPLLQRESNLLPPYGHLTSGMLPVPHQAHQVLPCQLPPKAPNLPRHLGHPTKATCPQQHPSLIIHSSINTQSIT